MTKKLSVVLAALLFCLTATVAFSLDYDDGDDEHDDQAYLQHIDDDGYSYGEWMAEMNRGRRGGGSHFGLRGARRTRMSGFFVPIAEGLDITDAQKNEFINIMVDTYRQRPTLGLEQIETVQKLSKEEQSDTPNHDAIVSLNKALGEIKGKRAILGHQSRSRIWQVLTPEQRAKVKEMQAEIDELHEEQNSEPAPRGRSKITN